MEREKLMQSIRVFYEKYVKETGNSWQTKEKRGVCQ